MITPSLTDIVENNQQYHEDDVIFQQDDDHLHYALGVCQYLNQHFPRHRVRRRGSIQWSSRLPDLCSRNFLFVTTPKM